MKKILASVTLISLIFGACSAAPLRHVPYPEGKLEGAAAVMPETINHADSPYFAMPDIFEMKSTNTRTVLSHFPTYEQTTEYTCGPAAALTVLYYYGDMAHTEKELAEAMKTRPYPYGTNPRDMAAGLRSLGYTVRTSVEEKPFATYEAFRDFLVSELKNGHPVLVENVEWGGHWRVVIGYDDMGTSEVLDDTLIFADPYDTSDHQMDGYTIGNGERFYEMWFDYALFSEEQRNQPWVIVEK